MRSLRTRLVLLALVGILPLAAMSGIGLLELVKQQRRQAERAALDITRALVTAVDAALDQSVAVLETLATAERLDTGDPHKFYERAQRVMAIEPNWVFIHLADPSGAVLLNTRHPTDHAVTPFVPEKDSFARVVDTLKPALGNLTRGPRDEWGVPLRVPVSRNGRLRFVLSGVIKPDAILDVVRRQRVPEDWLVSVFDAKGIRVARSRAHDKYIGTPPAPDLQVLMAKGGDEGYGVTRALEGETVYTAYTRSKRTGWVVAIGTPAHAIRFAAYQSFAVFGGGMLLSLLFAILAAVSITRSINRPIRALAKAARAPDEGEPLSAPQTDIREIADLASALITSDAAVKSSRLQAQTASRAKDEFLAMLGHELRNPLAPIVTALRLMELRRDDATADERRIIERQVAHLSRLVDDLLDISRITRGKIELNLERLDVATVVSGALEMTRPLLEKRARAIDLETPSTPVYIWGDITRLTQVVSNLLTNAIRHTPDDGAIVLRVRDAKDTVEIAVEDSGSGIAPDLLARVFDIFVQGRQSIDRRVGGLGLGLAIVKAMVELHGGTVSAASGGMNRGSTFTVFLPKSESAALSVPLPSDQVAVAAEHSGRILVVDDNVDAAETLAMLLGSAGYEVRTAADAESALALVESFVPKLAVLDIGLPGMDGYQLAIQLRSQLHDPDLKLIALTGYGRDSDRERAMASGFDVHLVKPADPQRLLDEVARLIKSPPGHDRIVQA
jgi:signal transduction histidine kinase/ActR/RegA family two-component response regulator